MMFSTLLFFANELGEDLRDSVHLLTYVHLYVVPSIE
jgi:hypothetical protein